MPAEVRSAVEKIWEEERNFEYDLIENAYKTIGSSCMLLEVGCGNLGLLTKEDRLVNLFNSSYGADIDIDALAKNKQVKFKVGADCNNLPFKEGTFDIISCRWLFEHLERPENTMKELSRVLNKRGYLYVHTPNLLNYAMLISKLTPLRFHTFVRGKEHENCPTYYRANTKYKIKKLAHQNGLEIKHLSLRPYSYMYYSFSKHLFFAMKKVSTYISKYCSWFNLKIVCLMQKNGSTMDKKANHRKS